MDKKIDDYKALIINGVNDKGDTDGNIDYVGILDEYAFHVDALIDYAIKKYPNVKIFQKIPDNCEFDVPIFFLTLLNNIVYLNTSDKKYGEKGLLFFPDEISLKQKENLFALAKKLSNVRVTIIYDLDFDDGLVRNKEFSFKSGISFEEMLDENFEKNGKDLIVQEKKPKH